MKFSKKDFDELIKNDGGSFKVKCINNAYKFCEKLAKQHYENFPVGSLLVPRSKRKYFYAIYAIARISDDIADELTELPVEERLAMLNVIESMVLDESFKSAPSGNPIFMALHDTFKNCHIPADPILKLLKAFEMDVEFVQPETWKDLENYCSYSANPVGELVLRIFDNYNDSTAGYSDSICTGLQLANFWQDLSRDLNNNRIYIPKKILKNYKIENNDLLNRNKINNLVDVLNHVFEKTDNYFKRGKDLVYYLDSKRLKAEIAFTIEGGKLIQNKNKNFGINLLDKRPSIKKAEFLNILLKIVFQYKLI